MRKWSASAAQPKPLSATAEQILDVAEMLIQTRSYSAFSYQDIADALGIRKASIHYHFATKAELGVAVIDRYAERFGGALAAMAKNESKSSRAMLDFYCEPYLRFAQTPDRVCMCGALAAEALALPPEMRERVSVFFKHHQNWLAGILERGARRGEFDLPALPARMARLVFGALQGALIVKRTTGDVTQLKDVVMTLKAQLTGGRSANATKAGRSRSRS